MPGNEREQAPETKQILEAHLSDTHPHLILERTVLFPPRFLGTRTGISQNNGKALKAGNFLGLLFSFSGNINLKSQLLGVIFPKFALMRLLLGMELDYECGVQDFGGRVPGYKIDVLFLDSTRREN